MPSNLLSKSKYLNGLQCPRLLWTFSHEPEKIPEPDAATQYIFDRGHMVGELAKKLYPDGVDIPTAHSPMTESKEILNIDVGVVDPRKSAEAVSTTYLHCILKGLHRSPRIINNPSVIPQCIVILDY